MGSIVTGIKTLLWVAVGLVLLFGPFQLGAAVEVNPLKVQANPPKYEANPPKYEATQPKLEVRETPTELRIELPGWSVR